MANPFDDGDATFVVLVNDEGQHSLWPSSKAAPAGWLITFGEDSRERCLEYVETHWIDLRPASLVAHALGGGRSHS
jgi:MbtH protein